MESWVTCEDGCGNCLLSVNHDNFLLIKPSNVLEWAHSVVDLVEDSIGKSTGIPLLYFITCTYGAYTSGQIAPHNDSRYMGSRTFNEDLIKQCISTISHVMMFHSTRRKEVARANSTKYKILSIDDLELFQREMMSQLRFNIIHAALDEISIVDTSVIVRTYKDIRQRRHHNK